MKAQIQHYIYVQITTLQFETFETFKFIFVCFFLSLL